MLNLLSRTMERGVFGNRKNILDLCLAIEYMVLSDDLQLMPLSCQIIDQLGKIKKKEIIIGIPIQVFIYGSIYKKQIEAFISRYYLGRYVISITFCPL